MPVVALLAICLCQPKCGMYARCLAYRRAHIRMCIYIQTYIYIGRSVYTMHHIEGGAGGDLPPMVCASCTRAPAVGVPVDAMHIHTRSMVCAHGIAAARAICSPLRLSAPCRWYIVPVAIAEAVCGAVRARCGCSCPMVAARTW